MNDKQIIDLFVTQVTKACNENNEPLPEIVKNHHPGDDRLYRLDKKTREAEAELPWNKGHDPVPGMTVDEFNEINNNTDELEIF